MSINYSEYIIQSPITQSPIEDKKIIPVEIFVGDTAEVINLRLKAAQLENEVKILKNEIERLKFLYEPTNKKRKRKN